MPIADESLTEMVIRCLFLSFFLGMGTYTKYGWVYLKIFP